MLWKFSKIIEECLFEWGLKLFLKGGILNKILKLHLHIVSYVIEVDIEIDRQWIYIYTITWAPFPNWICIYIDLVIFFISISYEKKFLLKIFWKCMKTL